MLKKKLSLPIKFHTLLKMEAFKSGKTMVAYMEDVAEEVEEQNITFRNYIKRRKNEKKEKFIPRF